MRRFRIFSCGNKSVSVKRGVRGIGIFELSTVPKNVDSPQVVHPRQEIALIGTNFHKKDTKCVNHLDDILFFLCYNLINYLSVVLCPYDTYRQEYIQVRGGTKLEQEEKTDNKRCHGGRYDNSSPESGSDLV